MNRILETDVLAPGISQLRVEAPKIARKHEAGQFVIVRPTSESERIPLTIAGADPEAGWIRLIVQGVGKTTKTLNLFEAGERVHDVAGPLGRAITLPSVRDAAVVAGGVGAAIALPVARALAGAGVGVVALLGSRSADVVILEADFRSLVGRVEIATEDGSRGHRGLVTDVLGDVLASPGAPGFVFTAGPVAMMRAVAEMTRPLGVATVASLNPLMVDGTGMCGGCRVSVGEHVAYACIDGPDFDAHLVDFDLLERRNRTYDAFEYYRDQEFDADDARAAIRRDQAA